MLLQHVYHGWTMFLIKQQRLFVIVRTGKNNIDRTIELVHYCSHCCSTLLPVLIVEQCCNLLTMLLTIMLLTMFMGCSTTMSTVVDNLPQVVINLATNLATVGHNSHKCQTVFAAGKCCRFMLKYKYFLLIGFRFHCLGTQYKVNTFYCVWLLCFRGGV